MTTPTGSTQNVMTIQVSPEDIERAKEAYDHIVDAAKPAFTAAGNLLLAAGLNSINSDERPIDFGRTRGRKTFRTRGTF